MTNYNTQIQMCLILFGLTLSINEMNAKKKERNKQKKNQHSKIAT